MAWANRQVEDPVPIIWDGLLSATSSFLPILQGPALHGVSLNQVFPAFSPPSMIGGGRRRMLA